MSTNTRSAVLILALSVSFVSPVHAVDVPAIPAPFHGKWRAADGTCETAPSTGVLIDANEVMFGETGFFVDRIVRANETEAEIFLSQPNHGGLRGVLHLFLIVSAHGRTLEIAAEDSLTAYHRCTARL